MIATVGELRRLLLRYADGVPVLIDDVSGRVVHVNAVECASVTDEWNAPADVRGQPVVVIS